jgi:hypothetical protein
MPVVLSGVTLENIASALAAGAVCVVGGAVTVALGDDELSFGIDWSRLTRFNANKQRRGDSQEKGSY